MKVDISKGELIDKITILEIKMDRIKDENKLKNVKTELRKIDKWLLKKCSLSNL